MRDGRADGGVLCRGGFRGEELSDASVDRLEDVRRAGVDDGVEEGGGELVEEGGEEVEGVVGEEVFECAGCAWVSDDGELLATLTTLKDVDLACL